MFKFQRLEVWKKAVELTDDVLDLVDSFPQKYQFNLGEQLKRAVISIATNIAEGCGRYTKREAANFYNYAKASTYEVVSLLVICSKRGLIPPQVDKVKIWKESENICKMLTGLINKHRR